MNLLLLALAFWLIRPCMKNLARIWQSLPVFVFLVFYPIALALMQGQDSILLLVLLAAALVALGRGREMTAGMLVALGLFKMQIVIPIALLFLLWRRWRFCGGFALAAGLVSLVSLWVVGFAQTAAYGRSLLSVGTNAAAADQFPLRVSIMANLRGLFFGLMTARLPAFWIQAVTIVISVAVLFCVAGFARRTTGGQCTGSRHHRQRDRKLLPVHPRLECVADSNRCNPGPIHRQPCRNSGARSRPSRSLDVRRIAGGAHVYIRDSRTFLPGLAAYMRLYGHPVVEFSP